MQQRVTQNAVLIGGLFRSDWSQIKETRSYEFVNLKVFMPINEVKLLSVAVNHFRGKKEKSRSLCFAVMLHCHTSAFSFPVKMSFVGVHIFLP